jgi:hypothetical protein
VSREQGSLNALARRVGLMLLVVASLAGGALTVRAAAGWTAETAIYPVPVAGLGQLTAQLGDEQARADALQARLDQLVAGSMDLAGALDEAATRLHGDASTASALRSNLVAAQARLHALRKALAAAGVPAQARTRALSATPPTGPIAAPTTTGPAAATTAPAVPAPAATYPPGVPADWPSSQPIPPMPLGCVQPQLELNGAWNCQH